MTWARWFEHPNNRRVALTQRGKITISTVFIGLDHNWSGQGPPILFETMIFGSQRIGDYQRRYSTWDESVAGHREAAGMIHFTDVIWEMIPALGTPDWSWKETLKYLLKGGDKHGNL